jgi:glycosyltransferase involved in cell wall biosynthesis
MKSIYIRFKILSIYIISAIQYYLKKEKKLIILDDIYPHLLSGFRIAEFNYYLEKIEDSVIYSTGDSFRYLHESRSFEEVTNGYERLYPEFNHRVFRYDGQKFKAKLAYSVFLVNIYNFLPQITKYKIPFIFTLYPGGGFQLGQFSSDYKLKQVFNSPYFVKVIVTTKITLDYLLNNNLCNENKILFIYGVVVNSSITKESDNAIRLIKKNKLSFDICFVAHKYSPEGKDKGYDIFIQVAKQLSKIHDNIKFHVVGNFNDTDIDITEIKLKIKFYNTLETSEFPDFYHGIDIILSPNSSFVLAPGAFDGFPTGACIEAGLNSVALFVTDDLNQNIFFKEGEEIVIISKEPTEIVNKILHYYLNPAKLYSIANNGKEKIQAIYNLEAQMKPRIGILEKVFS